MNTSIASATRARKAVDSARLTLDATKAKAKSSATPRGMNPDTADMNLSEEVRADIERKEDDFIAQTEEAEGVLKNVSGLCISRKAFCAC